MSSGRNKGKALKPVYALIERFTTTGKGFIVSQPPGSSRTTLLPVSACHVQMLKTPDKPEDGLADPVPVSMLQELPDGIPQEHKWMIVWVPTWKLADETVYLESMGPVVGASS